MSVRGKERQQFRKWRPRWWCIKMANKTPTCLKARRSLYYVKIPPRQEERWVGYRHDKFSSHRLGSSPGWQLF